MTTPTVGTFFSGGGIGLARLIGKVDFAFGVEYDPAISEVYKANISDRIITARVQDVDVTKLEPVDLFQVSPVCKVFSAAKTGGKESAEELSQAAAICAYLDYHKPPYFLLENVRGYIKSKSFQMIVVRLSRLGYTCRFTVENSANYGVPQTRERLILRAALDRPLPSLPDYAGRWIGWYEAIEDLIPSLPESKFSQWQLDRLPAHHLDCLPIGNQGDVPYVSNSELPSMTVLSSIGSRMRAFLVAGQNGSNEKVHRAKEGSSFALSAMMHGIPRAFIVSDQLSNSGQDVGIRAEFEPSLVVDTRPANKVRAFIVDGQPCNNGRLLTVPNGQEPVYTVQSSIDHRPAKAWLSQGRVVQMTPRALARFQSIPDWCKLPDKNGLACTVIGNGIPSLMGQGIIEAMLGLNESEVAALACSALGWPPRGC
jgi:site-specific DNA-cytosine methylase